MTCPECGKGRMKCNNTRETLPGTLLRYRVCTYCGIHRPSIERLCGKQQTVINTVSSPQKSDKFQY
jgi:hypothetical protein